MILSIGCEESANDVFRGILKGCDLDVSQVNVRMCVFSSVFSRC